MPPQGPRYYNFPFHVKIILHIIYALQHLSGLASCEWDESIASWESSEPWRFEIESAVIAGIHATDREIFKSGYQFALNMIFF